MSIADRTSRKPMERRAVHPVALAVAALLLLVLPAQLAGAQTAVSHTFTLEQGRIFLISQAGTSGIGTALQLKAALDNPAANLEVALLTPATPPTFECFPVGSQIMDDLDTSGTGGTCAGVDAADLTFAAGDAILVRVTDTTTTLTWSGTEPTVFTGFDALFEAADHWRSIPYNLVARTAADILDLLPGTSGGTATRVLTTLPPTFEFWNGSFGVNFTLPVGDGVVIRPNDGIPPPIPPECMGVNNGGTVELPPAGCSYLSGSQLHLLINGFPPPTRIIIAPIHGDFNCTDPLGCEIPAPNPDTPSTESFDSTLELAVTGEGLLAGIDCQLSMTNVPVVVITEPRDVGAAAQTFGAEMTSLMGTITAETDCNLFESLTIEAGVDRGLAPSLGSTTILQEGTGTGDFQIDSFFDINYRISFVGKAGSPIAGMSGTTLGTVKMGTDSSASTAMIPTLSTWGVMVLGLLLTAALAVMVLRRRAAGGAAPVD